MNLKKLERYLGVNLLGPGPRLIKKEFTGPRSHKVWETLVYTEHRLVFSFSRPPWIFGSPYLPHWCWRHLSLVKWRDWTNSSTGCWGQSVERFITDLWGLRAVFMMYGFMGQGALSVSSTGPVTFAIKICCSQFEAVSDSLLFYVLTYRGLVSLASPKPELIPWLHDTHLDKNTS